MDNSKIEIFDCYYAIRFLTSESDLEDDVQRVREALRFAAQCEKAAGVSERLKRGCRSALSGDRCYNDIAELCNEIVSAADKDTINKAKLLTVSK